MASLFPIFVSHKKIFATVGGIESMVKLIAHEFSSQFPSHTVCQGSSMSNFICSTKVDPSCLTLGTNNQIKSSYNLKKRKQPFFLYFMKMLTFSILAAFSLLHVVKKARKKGFVPIIHAFDTVYGGFAGAIVSKISGTPLISQTHGLRQKYIRTVTKSKLIHTLDYQIEQFTIRNSICLLSVNEEALNFWSRHGVNDDKLELMRVCVDLRKFSSSKIQRSLVRRDLVIDEKMFVVGFVGRLSPEKNVHLTLQAFYDAYSKNFIPKNSKLLIVGDGLLTDELNKLSVSLNLSDKVVFTGFRSDVPALMNGMDALVLPSSIEGNPTVVLEAMATGVPVICSDIPSHREIISHSENGLLFKLGDPDALSKELCIANQNKELTQKLIASAKKYVQSNNDLIDTIKTLRELYISSINQQAKSK